MSAIVGRKQEIEELERLYRSDRPEFVAVYGRRRVGKTFLIKQALKNRITFQHTGVSPIDQDDAKSRMKTQLESFYYSMLNHGLEGFKMPKSWMEAFYQLEQLLTSLDDGKRTDEIKLLPFTLKECEEYFEGEGIELSRYDIVQSHMVFGGIPYYLSFFRKGESFEKNTDRILFGRNPRLKDEFNRLFNAIFGNPEDCKKIIRLLATRHNGFTREEIAKSTGVPLGGGLSDTLAALAESDFILRYMPYRHSKVEHYKLIDNFCLFWLKYVEPNLTDVDYMTDNITSDVMRSWKGVAFEEVCWQHNAQIKRALEIGGVKSSLSAWSVKGDDENEGAQIDLLINRADNVVNLCEMKFSSGEYVISKDEESKLRNRIEVLKKTLSPKQTVHLTMITTYGVAYGKHSGIVQKQVVLDDLFE